MPSSRWFYLAPLVAPLLITAPAAGADLAHACKAAPSNDTRIESCTALIDSGKNLAFSYRQRGLSHAENGNYGKAIADYGQSLDLAPRDADTLRKRGDAYQIIGEYERAIADYNATLKQDPNHSDTYYNRGLVFTEMNELDRAIADFDQALKLRPDYGLAYLHRGNVHRAKGDSKRALADYDRALEIDEQNLDGLYFRGLTLAWLNRIDDAENDFQRALEMLQGDTKSDWIDSICWEAATFGRAKLALSYCDQAKKLFTDSGLLHSRAFVLWQLGDAAAARQELQTAHRLSPNEGIFDPSRRLKEFPLILVQGLLKGLGYDPRYVDGEPAPETTEAIRSFQQAQGMTVDGKVSDALIAALKAAQAS